MAHLSFVRSATAWVLCAMALPAAVLLPAADAAAVTGPTTVQMPSSVRSALLSAEDSSNVAVAVLDTRTNRYWGSSAAEQEFPAESVVKVLIAANLLATGQMTGTVEQQAYLMITQSDDSAADDLWGLVGEGGVVDWAQDRYGIEDLGSAPTEPGWWGNTKITARGMVELYAAITHDPSVGPWLIDAMQHMAATAQDGTDQQFGLAAQTTSGAFKQGWGGDDDAQDSEQLNSTGLLDGDRYAVAVLVQHIPYVSMSDLVPVINDVAAAVAPGGAVQMPPPAAPAPASPSSSVPSAVPSSSVPSSSAPSPSVSSSGTSTVTPTPAAVAATTSGDSGTRSGLRTVLAEGVSSGTVELRRHGLAGVGAVALLVVVLLTVAGGRRRARHR